MSCASSSTATPTAGRRISTRSSRPTISTMAPRHPGPRPGGAREDYENAVKQAGAVIGYTIDALVADGEMVAAVWTGTLPGGAEIGKGLSLYRTSGGLLRSTRHALIGTTPS